MHSIVLLTQGDPDADPMLSLNRSFTIYEELPLNNTRTSDGAAAAAVSSTTSSSPSSLPPPPIYEDVNNRDARLGKRVGSEQM